MAKAALRMSGLLAFLVASVAHAASGALGFDDARHLLNRTSFAAGMDEIDAFARLTREQAVERLLARTRGPRLAPPPRWADAPFESPRRLRAMSDEERRLFQREQLEKGVELRAWWLREMLVTPSPLTEKMTLFWHNHFVSSLQKVRSPQLMYRQNRLLREHALGNFRDFLHAIARDPAMVVYLDSASNRKGRPNENFAREVMELFTLGEGNYAERDIKEAARAFTGWSVDPESGEFVFRRGQHDDGVKTVLGVSGNLDGGAVLDILLAQPQTAEFIVARLWREFVSPEPEAQEVRRIARAFRDSGYDIRTALRALLLSEAFYAPQHRAVLVKSPVELVVGTLRQFRFAVGEPLPFVFVLGQLGQNLFAPPNVKGWPGGEAWINASTLLARKAFLDRLFRAQEMPAARPMTAADPGGANLRERALRAMAEVRLDYNNSLFNNDNFNSDGMARLLLATAPATPPTGLQGMALIRHLTQDPVYQLK